MSNENSLSGVKRRDFLKILSLTSIGSLVYSKELLASKFSTNDMSNVVVVYNQNATDKTNKTISTKVVQSMVDQGIKAFTDIAEVGEAWKSIFPGITEKKIIALKVNASFQERNNGTHQQVTYAVANGLTQMDFDGIKFPDNNIIIFDFSANNYLNAQGYTKNDSNKGIRCFASPGYSAEDYNVAGIKVKLSTVITQMADYLINIGYLKHHSMSGVSHCLKNHFGTINSPLNCHDNAANGVSINNCIAALNELEPIKLKQKFCIIDALYGITNNGPGGTPTCAPNKIIMGQDIVAVDCAGRNLLKTSGMSQNDFNRTTHIDIAATKYSLGTNDPNKINLMELTNTTVAIESIQEQIKTTELLQNYPNPFNTKTTIPFYLASTEHVQFIIRDYTGKEIIQLVNKTIDQGTHKLTWDGRNVSGSDVPNNIFIGELKTISYNQSIIIQKVN